MQPTVSEIIEDTSPLFQSDTIVFGVLMIILGFIFYTSSKKDGPLELYLQIGRVSQAMEKL